MQIRMNTDADLKRAIDTNFPEWNNFTVAQAIMKIGEVVRHVSNSSVYRKQFDEMNKKDSESIRESVTHLRSCAIDCNFVCTYDETHDLSDYHIINRIRNGVSNKILQQELLQRADKVNTLPLITQYCENFESAKNDQELLAQSEKNSNYLCEIEMDGLSKDDLVAAISSYNKSKNQKGISVRQSPIECGRCGYTRAEKSCPTFGQSCNKCGKLNHFQKKCCVNTARHSASKSNSQITSVVFATIEKLLSSSGNASSLPKVNTCIKTYSKETFMDCIPDTGAQVTVGGLQQMKQLQISKEQLLAPHHTLKHAGGKRLNVIGSCKATIQHNKQSIDTDIYFATEISNMYLSLNLCKQLKLVHEEFPHIDVSQK